MALNLGHIHVAFPPLLAGASRIRLMPLKQGLRADSYRLTFERQGEVRDLLVKHFKESSDFSRHEIASSRLCADLNVRVAPQLVALHEGMLLLVTRYLNGARDLMAMIANSDGESFTSEMKQLGRVTATLISATCLDFSLNRESDDSVVRVAEADALTAKLPTLFAWGEALGVAAPQALRDCAMRLLQSYRDPFRVSWSQGDPAPSNVLFADGRAWLVDFEYGGWRHALHDLAQWYVRAPMPETWYATLSATVAESLLRGGIYADDDAFRSDLSIMQSYAALYMLNWVPAAGALECDQPWVDAWSVRDTLICSTARGAAAAGRVPGLEPLARWFRDLHASLAVRWPERGTGEPDWYAIASAQRTRAPVTPLGRS